MQEKDGKYIFGVVKISEKGQIVIPKEALKTYNLQAGDALLLVVDKTGLALITTDMCSDFVGAVMEDLNP